MLPHLRLLNPRDLPAVMQVQAEAYSDLGESRDALASRLESAPDWCWGAERNGKLCAYLLTHPWHRDKPPAWNQPLPHPLPTPGHFHIHDLALSPLARGSGVAPRLIANALAAARQAGLHEARLIAVQGSRVFWEKQGFRLKAVTPAMQAELESYGADACLMHRAL